MDKDKLLHYKRVCELVESITEKDSGCDDVLKNELLDITVQLTNLPLEQQLSQSAYSILMNASDSLKEWFKFLNLNIVIQTGLVVSDEAPALLTHIPHENEVSPSQDIGKHPEIVWLFIANHCKLK